jgi:hypothetical protein
VNQASDVADDNFWLKVDETLLKWKKESSSAAQLAG